MWTNPKWSNTLKEKSIIIEERVVVLMAGSS